MISDTLSTFPGVPIVAGIRGSHRSVGGGLVTTITYQKNATKHDSRPGAVWNELIAEVDTPYVFVGYELDRVDRSLNIFRMVRSIECVSDYKHLTTSGPGLRSKIRVMELLNASVVGSAIRRPSGHWSANCAQINYRNYSLAFVPGYRQSEHECLRCDHVGGPFLARTGALRKVKFDNFLSQDLLLMDLFTRVSECSKVGLTAK